MSLFLFSPLSFIDADLLFPDISPHTLLFLKARLLLEQHYSSATPLSFCNPLIFFSIPLSPSSSSFFFLDTSFSQYISSLTTRRFSLRARYASANSDFDIRGKSYASTGKCHVSTIKSRALKVSYPMSEPLPMIRLFPSSVISAFQFRLLGTHFYYYPFAAHSASAFILPSSLFPKSSSNVNSCCHKH